MENNNLTVYQLASHFANYKIIIIDQNITDKKEFKNIKDIPFEVGCLPISEAVINYDVKSILIGVMSWQKKSSQEVI